MTKEQFKIAYPKVSEWIHCLLVNSAPKTRAVSSIGFSRLPRYFNSELLDAAKFVVVPGKPPVPPLLSMGLDKFAQFEQEELEGVTYWDTFFVRQSRASDESLYFHELIHVLQWYLLGQERFLMEYADGYEKHGIKKAPLEVMAYDAENMFVTVAQPFDARKLVEEQLRINFKIPGPFPDKP